MGTRFRCHVAQPGRWDSGRLGGLRCAAGADCITRLAARRELEAENRSVVPELLEQCAVIDQQVAEDEKVATLLRLAAGATTGRTKVVLELVSACWDGPGTPKSTCARLAELLPMVEVDDPLGLNMRCEWAYWSGEAGDVVAARDQFTELVPVCVRVLGVEHQDTLVARSNLAYWSGEAGDVVAARDRFAELVPVCVRVLGVEHRTPWWLARTWPTGRARPVMWWRRGISSRSWFRRVCRCWGLSIGTP